MKKSIIKILKIVAGLYILIAALLFFFQEKLIFFPEKLEKDYRFNFGKNITEINIKTRDTAAKGQFFIYMATPAH